MILFYSNNNSIATLVITPMIVSLTLIHTILLTSRILSICSIFSQKKTRAQQFSAIVQHVSIQVNNYNNYYV